MKWHGQCKEFHLIKNLFLLAFKFPYHIRLAIGFSDGENGSWRTLLDAKGSSSSEFVSVVVAYDVLLPERLHKCDFSFGSSGGIL